MKLTWIILFLCLAGNSDQLKLVKKQYFPGSVDSGTVDQFENVYSTSGSKLTKMDKNARVLFEYTSSVNTAISQVDVSNPLRILAYFGETNQLVFLDKQLTELNSPVFLDDLGHYRVSAVCASERGGFWLVDEHQKKLFYYNQLLENTRSSMQIDYFGNVMPKRIMEQGKKVYAYYPGDGFVLFDQNGGYIKSIPARGSTCFGLSARQIWYNSGNDLIVKDVHLVKSDTIVVDLEKPLKNLEIIGQRLYLFTADSYSLYLFE